MFGPRMRNPRRRGFTSARLEGEGTVNAVRARAYQAPEREHTPTTNRSADDDAPRVAVGLMSTRQTAGGSSLSV